MKHFFFYALALLLVAGCAYDIASNEAETAGDDSTMTVIRARFDQADTKSRLDMNKAGTYAKVLWTAGDAISVITNNSYYKEFTTADDGVAEADFSCSGWNPSSASQFFGFYPASRFKGYYNGGLGVYLPSVQNAVAGGVEEGMNMAFAVTSSLADGLTFKNFFSLVKFRLSGDVVSSLSSIKFVGNTELAGDIVAKNVASGEPTYDFNAYMGETRQESPTNVIELRGSFTAGTDYYMIMFPGTTDGFSMIFQNAKGEYVIKESSKMLTLTRSHIVDFGTINVGSSFGDPAVTQYMTATSGLDPVDIVVLPDGFTSKQRAAFENMAASGIDFLFATEPYKSYKDYFNVYFMWKASEEEGASICNSSGEITTARNTAFGSYWEETDYNHMAADEDKVYGFVSNHCPEIVQGELTIDEVPIVLLINDTRYGGRAHSTSSGRTYCQVPYTDAGGTMYWSYPDYVPISDEPESGYRKRTDADLAEVGGVNSGDWRNTLLHEFGGHSFGRLKDEYWYGGSSISVYPQGALSEHSWPVPFGLNVSGYYNTLPWQSLLDRRSSLIAVDSRYERIGVFQGGDVNLLNRWRSEKISCMIDNRQYFSTWQRVLIAKRIVEMAGGSFDLDTFLASDDPTDPVRDGGKMSGARAVGPVRIMPPLAPPELVDNSVR